MEVDLKLTSPAVIHGDALFSENRKLRYRLRRWWTEKPIRFVTWLMQNPSHAKEVKNDLTVGRVIKFSRSWGYDGLVVVNTSPFISSTPKENWEWMRWDERGPDWYARDQLQANLEHIERAGRESALRMVAHGAEPKRREEGWLEQCLEAYQQPSEVGGDENLYCLGVSESGEPVHPLARGKHRISDETKPQLWRSA